MSPPSIPWQVFATLVTVMMAVGTAIIGWAVWRGNQSAQLSTLARAFEAHLLRDEHLNEAIAGRLEQIGAILSVIQQRQAVTMDRLGIPG